MELEVIIGLEIHVQLKTKSKMFCGCSTDTDFAKPNTNICPVCMGQPGTLPVVNHQAINFAHRICLALDFDINQQTRFDRKNYFYPDLPKGYQISQHELPMGENGKLPIKIDKKLKYIEIERVHLEEDTGKLIHPKDLDYSLVDYNRAGTPLCEIVTKPVIGSPAEAKKFMQELQLLMRYLEVSDADMEKGQMRCDGNISLRPKGKDKLYPKTEIKNLNSFKALEKALEYEIKRQTKLWEAGKAPEKSATMGWDDTKNVTVLQRVKQTLADYRYFPEPDIPPMSFSDDDIKNIERTQIPELPWQKRERFKNEFNISGSEVEILIANPELANYTEQVISELVSWLNDVDEFDTSTGSVTAEEIWDKYGGKISKLALSWVTNRLKVILDKDDTSAPEAHPPGAGTPCLAGRQALGERIKNVTPENMAELITMVYTSQINSNTAQKVLEIMVETGGDPSHIIEEEDLSQISDEDELSKIIEQVISENPDQVAEYKAGKEPLIKYFIGQAMRLSKGKADPEVVEGMLVERLK